MREAGARSARPMVITFDHHPDEIITGEAPPLLCDPDERLRAASRRPGVEATVVVHFDQRLRETTYDAFVARIADRAPIAGFLMTPDAAFGYRRERDAGDPRAPRRRALGFDVVVVPPFELGGHPVRSTEVRTAIGAGDIALAARLLGRPHAVVGRHVDRVAGERRRGSRSRSPCRRTAPGTSRSRPAPDPRRPSPTSTRVRSSLDGVPAGTWVRVAFTGRREVG